MKYSKAIIALVLLFLHIHVSGQMIRMYAKIGDNAAMLGEWQNSLDTYSLGLDIEPNNIELLLKRANAHIRLGNIKEGQRDLDRANELNPFSRIFLKEDMRNQAIAKKYYSINPNDDNSFKKDYKLNDNYSQLLDDKVLLSEIDSLVEIAMIMLLNNEYDEAEQIVDQLIEDGATNCVIYDIKGITLMNKEDPELAITYFNLAIEDNPEFTLGYHNRAVAYMKMGNYLQAEKDFQSALKLNGSMAYTYFGLAYVHQKQNQDEQAMSVYKMALEENPELSSARINYSVMLKTLGNYTSAMFEINKTIDNLPDKPEPYFVRGGLYLIYGEYEKSMKDFETYLDSYPNDGEALHNQGINHLLLHDPKTALEYFEAAVKNGHNESSEMLTLLKP